jgi:hypothetical protein
MRGFKIALLAAAGTCLMIAVPAAEAQITVNIGAAPECPYGYYDAAPFDCAPSGYYGPEWFSGDVFIGAGPWFHGPSNFRGNVNNAFHPQHGYKGTMPNRGEKAEWPSRRDGSIKLTSMEMKNGMDAATQRRANANLRACAGVDTGAVYLFA